MAVPMCVQDNFVLAVLLCNQVSMAVHVEEPGPVPVQISNIRERNPNAKIVDIIPAMPVACPSVLRPFCKWRALHHSPITIDE